MDRLWIFRYPLYTYPEVWQEMFLNKFGNALNPFFYFNIIAWLVSFPGFAICAVITRHYGALSDDHQEGFEHSALTCLCLIVFGTMSIASLSSKLPNGCVTGISLGGLMVGFMISMSAALDLHTVPTVANMAEYVGGFYLSWNHTPYIVESIHYEKNCCGIISLYDYIDVSQLDVNPEMAFNIPDSCCKRYVEGCGRNATALDITPEGPYKQIGCGLEGYEELYSSAPQSMWVMSLMFYLSRFQVIITVAYIVGYNYSFISKWPQRKDFHLVKGLDDEDAGWETRSSVHRNSNLSSVEFKNEVLLRPKANPRFRTKFQEVIFHASPTDVETHLNPSASETLASPGTMSLKDTFHTNKTD